VHQRVIVCLAFANRIAPLDDGEATGTGLPMQSFLPH
jgi:hypothetical protein